MQYKTDRRLLQSNGDWTATREEGLLRLAEFSESAGAAYARERNYDFGQDDRRNVSVLSPYVRRRLITEAEIAAETLASHDYAAAQSFLQEVCWRTYWKGWLQMRPGVWDRYCADVERLAVARERDSELAARVRAAENGETGIECFDAWATELRATGYLHNHARMWFASIWIYTLKLPWQLGADHFMRYLLDGDPASNTLSWRWMCGLHTVGKTYLARAANIAEFTGGRFPPPKGLAGAAEPLTESVPLAAPLALPSRKSPPEGPVALLVTDEDLSPETLNFGRAQVKAVILASRPRAPGVSAKVVAFDERARADAGRRAEKHFWAKPQTVDLAAERAAETIAEAAAGLPVVTAETPVGPAATALAGLDTELQRRGVTMHAIRREWDDAFWPHASRGFFQMRDKIPETLRALGLPT